MFSSSSLIRNQLKGGRRDLDPDRTPCQRMAGYWIHRSGVFCPAIFDGRKAWRLLGSSGCGFCEFPDARRGGSSFIGAFQSVLGFSAVVLAVVPQVPGELTLALFHFPPARIPHSLLRGGFILSAFGLFDKGGTALMKTAVRTHSRIPQQNHRSRV